jgi:hypothetical protein
MAQDHAPEISTAGLSAARAVAERDDRDAGCSLGLVDSPRGRYATAVRTAIRQRATALGAKCLAGDSCCPAV